MGSAQAVLRETAVLDVMGLVWARMEAAIQKGNVSLSPEHREHRTHGCLTYTFHAPAVSLLSCTGKATLHPVMSLSQWSRFDRVACWKIGTAIVQHLQLHGFEAEVVERGSLSDLFIRRRIGLQPEFWKEERSYAALTSSLLHEIGHLTLGGVDARNEILAEAVIDLWRLTFVEWVQGTSVLGQPAIDRHIVTHEQVEQMREHMLGLTDTLCGIVGNELVPEHPYWPDRTAVEDLMEGDLIPWDAVLSLL